MGKHFECIIGEGSFTWSRRTESIAQEQMLDGIYVLRTSEPAECRWQWAKGPKWQDHKDHSATG
jgi:hypothetical protein